MEETKYGNEKEIASEGEASTGKSKGEAKQSKACIAPCPRKRRKVKSLPHKDNSKIRSQIWLHFTRLESDNERASCNYCEQEFDASTKTSSNLKNHLELVCKKSPLRIVDGQITLDKNKSKAEPDGHSSSITFQNLNVQEIRLQLARMFIIDELPFRIVEGEGFRRFFHALESRFVVPSQITVARDCMALYYEEKKKLKKILKSQRVCLTIDTWSSIQNLNYICLTAHWIGSDWKFQKRIISFSQVPNHKEETIGKSIEESLLEWGIDKVFTLTVDNARFDDGAIRYLKRRSKGWKGTILGHDFMHIRCCTHIMNLIVRDGLEEENDLIVKIRNAVRYVRSCPSRLDLFKKCVEKEKIESRSLVCLDVETRWNSTYLMLESTVKFQRAFERLEEDDPEYLMYFNGSEEDENDVGSSRSGKVKAFKHIGPPTFLDWENARCFVIFLKLFYDVTLNFSSSLCVTSNCFFHELVGVQTRLAQLIKSGDTSLKLMASCMQSKFDKYWGSLDNLNFVLFVAIVLDPRYKLKYVQFCFNQLHGNDSQVTKFLVENVESTLNRLYDHYANHDSSASVELEAHNPSQSVTSMDIVDIDCISKFLRSQFAKHLKEEQSMECKSEVAKYLTDAFEIHNASFDILEWWKMNSERFPILSQVARDVLVVQISTVATEYAFSTCGRVLDQFRSSLSPKMMEALLCCQNWLRSTPSSIDLREAMEEVEKYEAIERGISSSSSSCAKETIGIDD